MPGMNGIDALREIKKLKPLTAVIMLTGQATVEAAIEGMKLGADDFLQKPCATEDLLSEIDKAYERKQNMTNV
jgi:FixJ family two-component response regulator